MRWKLATHFQFIKTKQRLPYFVKFCNVTQIDLNEHSMCTLVLIHHSCFWMNQFVFLFEKLSRTKLCYLNKIFILKKSVNCSQEQCGREECKRIDFGIRWTMKIWASMPMFWKHATLSQNDNATSISREHRHLLIIWMIMKYIKFYIMNFNFVHSTALISMAALFSVKCIIQFCFARMLADSVIDQHLMIQLNRWLYTYLVEWMTI